MAKQAGAIRVSIEADVTRLEKGMDQANKKIAGLQATIRKLSADGKKDLHSLASQFDTMFKFQALKLGYQAIKNLTTELKELADAGDGAADVRDAFTAIGGSLQSIDAAKDKIKGLVDKFELMRISSQGMMKGLPDMNKNFQILADYGAKFAQAWKLDTKQAIEDVTNAVATMKEKALKNVGIKLDLKGMSELEKFEAIIAKIKEQAAILPEVQLGVADSIGVMQVAMSEARKEFAMGINDSTELANAFQAVGEAVASINWEEIGKAIGDIAGIISQSLLPYLQKIPGIVKDIAIGLGALKITAGEGKGGFLQYMLGNPVQGAWGGLKEWAGNLSPSKLAMAIATQGGSLAVKGLAAEGSPSLWQSIGNAQAKADEAQLGGLYSNIDKLKKLFGEGLPQAAIKAGTEIKNTLSTSSDEGKKLAKELEADHKAWEDFVNGLEAKDLTEALQNSIDAVNVTEFKKLLAQLQQQIAIEYEAKFGKARQSGAITQEQYDFGLNKNLEVVTNKFEDNMDGALAKSGKKAKEYLQDGFRDAVSFFQSGLERIFSGEIIDGKDFLKDALMIGGSNLAGAFSAQAGAALKEAGYDFGSAASELLMGTIGFGKGENGKIDSKLAEAADDMKASSLYAATAIQSAIAVLGAVINAGDINKQTQSEAGTGGAVGTAGGAIAGAIIGNIALPGLGALIGASFGSTLGNTLGQLTGGLFEHGPQDPETRARHEFAGWLEEEIKKLRSISFYGTNGQLQTTGTKGFDFLENRQDFSKDWGNKFNSMGAAAQATFKGLGAAFKSLSGITDDTFEHIGYLLAENFGGNIDNARLLVYQLGLSFDDLKKRVDEAALAGDMRWSEYNQAISGLQDAFKEGLSAVGDLIGAYDEFVAAGGRGRAAVKGLKDIIVEAGEKGITSAAGIEQYLLSQGKNAEEVKAIVSQINELMKGHKLGNLKDILGLSDTDIGSAIGNMESLSESLRKQWEQIGADIDSLNEKLESIPKDIESNVKITADIDPNLQKLLDSNLVNGGSTAAGANTGDVKIKKAARGALLTGPAVLPAMLAGEAGPEAIMPLGKVNGRLGVHAVGPARVAPALNISIDARGADAGVEQRIRRALAAVKQSAVNEVLDKVYRGRA